MPSNAFLFDAMLCQAVDLFSRAADFYDRATADCDAAMAGVFGRLKDLKLARLARLQAMQEDLAGGKGADAVCRLSHAEALENEAVLGLAEAKALPRSCPPSAQAAIDAALALELELKTFFETRREAADFPDEKSFLSRMVQEVTGHFMLLNDMKYYFENPDAWTFAKQQA